MDCSLWAEDISFNAPVAPTAVCTSVCFIEKFKIHTVRRSSPPLRRAMARAVQSQLHGQHTRQTQNRGQWP